MASTVYSNVFLREYTEVDLSTDLVPDGVVWIIRDIDISADIVSASGLYCYIGSVLLFNLQLSGSSGIENYGWRGRQVLRPGEYVEFQPTGATNYWHLNVSGYVLTLP